MVAKKILKEFTQWALPKAERKMGGETRRHALAHPERDMKRPLEEISRTTEKTERLTPKRTIHPDELVKQRALIISGGFDRSPAGERLTKINEEPLENPVDMKGGQDFGRAHEGQGPDKLIGKSGGQVIQKKAKETRAAAERFGAVEEGRPIYFSPWSMSLPSVDFNEMQARIQLERLRNAPIAKEDLLRLELALQMNTPEKGMPMPRFKDMWKDPELMNLWLENAGTGRTNLTRIPEMAAWQKVPGMPDTASTRFAGTDPDLFNLRQGDTGRVFYQADPSGRVVTDPFYKRADYSTGWGGVEDADVRGFQSDIPLDLMQPDYVAQMRRNMEAKGTDPSKLTMNMIMNGTELGAPVQEATPEWRDNIMRYVERHGLKMAIAAGILTPAQAMTYFGTPTGETS